MRLEIQFDSCLSDPDAHPAILLYPCHHSYLELNLFQNDLSRSTLIVRQSLLACCFLVIIVICFCCFFTLS